MALLDRIIWQIEANLAQEDITIEMLAEACAVSRFHMCRAFRQATGVSIMSYVRGRRLSVAAQAIGTGDDTLLSIALEAGYGSHEAFTRAFLSYFGVLPNTVRKARSTKNLTLLEPVKMKKDMLVKDMLVDVEKPEFRDHKAFRVVGLSTQCSFDDIGGIPALWSKFNAQEDVVRVRFPGRPMACVAMRLRRGSFAMSPVLKRLA